MAKGKYFLTGGLAGPWHKTKLEDGGSGGGAKTVHFVLEDNGKDLDVSADMTGPEVAALKASGEPIFATAVYADDANEYIVLNLELMDKEDDENQIVFSHNRIEYDSKATVPEFRCNIFNISWDDADNEWYISKNNRFTTYTMPEVHGSDDLGVLKIEGTSLVWSKPLEIQLTENSGVYSTNATFGDVYSAINKQDGVRVTIPAYNKELIPVYTVKTASFVYVQAVEFDTTSTNGKATVYVIQGGNGSETLSVNTKDIYFAPAS